MELAYTFFLPGQSALAAAPQWGLGRQVEPPRVNPWPNWRQWRRNRLLFWLGAFAKVMCWKWPFLATWSGEGQLQLSLPTVRHCRQQQQHHRRSCSTYYFYQYTYKGAFIQWPALSRAPCPHDFPFQPMLRHAFRLVITSLVNASSEHDRLTGFFRAAMMGLLLPLGRRGKHGFFQQTPWVDTMGSVLLSPCLAALIAIL